MNELGKHLLSLLPVIIGGLLVWIGTLISDHRRVVSEKRAALRTAYSRWFTSERTLIHQMRTFADLSKEIPDNRERYDELPRETEKIQSTLKENLHSLHEIYLVENDSW